MGAVKTNVYVTPHVCEGGWEDFTVRVHHGSLSINTTSPPDEVKTHYTGLIDASGTESNFSTYIENNMSTSWKIWFNNRVASTQVWIRLAFAELR